MRQRFHVWQRNYDVYLGKQQVAAINSPLLAWEFAVKDAQGGTHRRTIHTGPQSTHLVGVWRSFPSIERGAVSRQALTNSIRFRSTFLIANEHVDHGTVEQAVSEGKCGEGRVGVNMVRGEVELLP